MTAVTRLLTGENIETRCSNCYKILGTASLATVHSSLHFAIIVMSIVTHVFRKSNDEQ